MSLGQVTGKVHLAKKVCKRQYSQNCACGERVGCTVSTFSSGAQCVVAFVPNCQIGVMPSMRFSRNKRIRDSRSNQVLSEKLGYTRTSTLKEN